MWQYNYSPELCHFGIKGMKWGRRRYQNTDGSLTPAGEKRYNADRVDKIIYGEKGAQRIADRRNKGDSAKKARAKEAARQIGTKTAVAAGVFAGSVLATKFIADGGASYAAKKIVNAGKKAVENYNNISILDSSGKVVTRYRENVKVGEAAVNALIKRS